MIVSDDAPAVVTVRCDGPTCEQTAAAPAGADPRPEGWLGAWGPPERLGRFDFHSGACYDAWWAEVMDMRTERDADK